MKQIPEVEIRHDAAEIRERVEKLARRLDQRLKGQEILVVGVLKGSAMFLSDLVRSLETPSRFEFIDVDRQDESDGAGEPRIAIRFFRHFSVANHHVLVLKDVVNTGVVEGYLLSQLRSQGPKSLALACVIDRPAARRMSLEVDEALFVEPEDQKWVGYGLDFGDGSFAHRANLGILKPV